jgi:PhnB protein
MVSDAPGGGLHPSPADSNISIALNFSDLDEAQRAFAALSANGKVIMPIADSFWGASFGMAMDPFGVTWLFKLPEEGVGARSSVFVQSEFHRPERHVPHPE